MKTAHEYFKKKYPKAYQCRDLPLDVGPGWLDLLDNFLGALGTDGILVSAIAGPVYLLVGIDNATNEGHSLVANLQDLSSQTCRVCGADKGKLIQRANSWMILCSQHARSSVEKAQEAWVAERDGKWLRRSSASESRKMLATPIRTAKHFLRSTRKS